MTEKWWWMHTHTHDDDDNNSKKARVTWQCRDNKGSFMCENWKCWLCCYVWCVLSDGFGQCCDSTMNETLFLSTFERARALLHCVPMLRVCVWGVLSNLIWLRDAPKIYRFWIFLFFVVVEWRSMSCYAMHCHPESFLSRQCDVCVRAVHQFEWQINWGNHS